MAGKKRYWLGDTGPLTYDSDKQYPPIIPLLPANYVALRIEREGENFLPVAAVFDSYGRLVPGDELDEEEQNAQFFVLSLGFLYPGTILVGREIDEEDEEDSGIPYMPLHVGPGGS